MFTLLFASIKFQYYIISHLCFFLLCFLGRSCGLNIGLAIFFCLFISISSLSIVSDLGMLFFKYPCTGRSMSLSYCLGQISQLSISKLFSLLWILSTREFWSDLISAPGYVLSDFMEFLNLLFIKIFSIWFPTKFFVYLEEITLYKTFFVLVWSKCWW